jgi:hypothetical protein
MLEARERWYRSFLGAALVAVVVAAPVVRAAPSSWSGTISDAESGIALDVTVHGGDLTAGDQDGWDLQVTGTIRAGETLSIAASANTTTWSGRHHVNEDREASLSTWVEGTDDRDDALIPAGQSDSVSVTHLIESGTRTVRAVAVVSGSWINPHGGGSRTLIVRVALDVVEPDTTAAPSTTRPTTSPPASVDDDCETVDYSPQAGPGAYERYGVRFGDLHGEVNVKPACADEDAYVFAELGTPLHHDDMIRTSPRSGAILSFSDMTTFIMGPESIVVLDVESPRESKVDLFFGNVLVNLRRMVEDGSFEVEMAQAIAGARGTTFVVDESDGESVVKAIEGAVAVTPRTGDPLELVAGQMVRVGPDGPGPVEDFDAAGELASWGPEAEELVRGDGNGPGPDRWTAFGLPAWVLAAALASAAIAAAVSKARSLRE